MPRSDALVNIPDDDFRVVKEYLSTGESAALSPQHKRMISICRDSWGLMSKYPQRNVLIKQLMAQHGLQYKEAAKYVDFTRATWGNYQAVTQDFLQNFFVDQLLRAISDSRTDISNRVKLLSILQKHLQQMPHSEIDPSLMESNTIMINFNLGDKNLQLSQKVIRALPKEVQEQLLAGVHNDITDAEAEEILDS